jgi:hypothetical protein
MLGFGELCAWLQKKNKQKNLGRRQLYRYTDTDKLLQVTLFCEAISFAQFWFDRFGNFRSAG